MKQEWVYTWETVPGNGVVTQTYPTREEAGKPWIKISSPTASGRIRIWMKT